MASREDEKRQRREEREAAEAAAAKAETRKRIILVGFGVATVGTVLAIVAILLLSGGGDDKSSMSVGSTGKVGGSDATIPEQKTKNFNAAVKAAGCVYKDFPSEGNTHSDKPFDDYKTNPPTSGTHNPTPAEDGVYDPGNSPDPNNWVHSLEHGRIEIQYAPGTPQRRIAQLQALQGEPVKGSPGYHMMLFENNTDMPYEVAAVAWTRSLTCKTFNEQTFDAIRVFRDRFVDKGPEFIP